MARIPLNALIANADSVSEYGSAQVLGSIMTTAALSARTTHIVATVGSPATYQPTSPAAATPSSARSTRLAPPTPRLIESTRMADVPTSWAITTARLQRPPSARCDASTITERMHQI